MEEKTGFGAGGAQAPGQSWGAACVRSPKTSLVLPRASRRGEDLQEDPRCDSD